MASSPGLYPGSDKFSSPSEFTSIDTAVIGQQSEYSVPIGQGAGGRNNQNKFTGVYSDQSPPPKLAGTLKVPKETTPIDVAVFRMPYENSVQGGNSIGTKSQSKQILADEKGRASAESVKVIHHTFLFLEVSMFPLCKKRSVFYSVEYSKNIFSRF